MLTILRLIVIAIFGYFAYSYYNLVMPSSLSALISILITCGLLLTLIMGNTSLGIMLKGGITLLTWPAGVYVVSYICNFFGVQVSTNVAITAAPIFAAAAGRLTYQLAANKDRARDLATISLGFISLYTMAYAITMSDKDAILMASITVAVCGYFIKEMIELPPYQKNVLTVVIGMPVVGAVFTLISAAF